MSYDEWDAMMEEHESALYNEIGPIWARDHAAELFEEHYEEAVRQFTSERLTSYYLANPDLAKPAFVSKDYAQLLIAEFPRATLVFASTTIEWTMKRVLLRPLVYGLVHNDVLAELIAESTVPNRKGVPVFDPILDKILVKFGGVNLRTFTRAESSMPLGHEIEKIKDARNRVVHGASTEHDDFGPLALDVAATLLDVIFPKLLSKWELTLDETHKICQSRVSSS